MAECITRLEQDLVFDCNNKPVAGIEKKILLVNREDIDLGGTVIDGNKITTLVLKSGKTAFSVDGIAKHLSFTSKPVVDPEGMNGHAHTLSFRVYKNDAEYYKQIDAFVDNANLVAIVERNNKGESGKGAFDILGWHLGLEVSGDSEGLNIHEKEGVYSLNLATPDGMKEPRSLYKWVETDYATTKAKFDNKLA